MLVHPAESQSRTAVDRDEPAGFTANPEGIRYLRATVGRTGFLYSAEKASDAQNCGHSRIE